MFRSIWPVARIDEARNPVDLKDEKRISLGMG